MAGSKNWKVAAKDSKLDKMHADITKIVNNFSMLVVMISSLCH